MAEEKKEETKPAIEAVQKPTEPVKPAAPGAESKVEAQPAAADPVKAPEAEKKEGAKIEKPVNCASCNKSIKNKRCYYRNGKYYCSKRCWQTASKKDKAPEAQATPNA